VTGHPGSLLRRARVRKDPTTLHGTAAAWASCPILLAPHIVRSFACADVYLGYVS